MGKENRTRDRIEEALSSYPGKPLTPGLIKELNTTVSNILESAFAEGLLKEEIQCIIIQPINYNIEILFIDKNGKIINDFDKYERRETEESK